MWAGWTGPGYLSRFHLLGVCLRRPATARLGDYSRRLAGHPVDARLADGHLRCPAADHPVDGLPHCPVADHPADGLPHYPVADHPADGLPHYPVADHPADGHLHCPVDGHPRCPAADYLAGDRQHSRVADGPPHSPAAVRLADGLLAAVPHRVLAAEAADDSPNASAGCTTAGRDNNCPNKSRSRRSRSAGRSRCRSSSPAHCCPDRDS